jgi:Pro-kumamolisin, activation domain/Bacterial Ig-like domain (group 3)
LRKLCSVLSVPVLLALAFAAFSQGSQAQTVLRDRITEPVDHANMSPIAGSIHPMARSEFEQGLTDNAKVLQGLSINFKRSDTQEASLKALMQAQQDPASPSYHKWLTQTQFGQQFGMSSADLAKVSAWLQQEGFTITSVAQSSNSISFSGSVAAAEKAFQTQIHNYSVNGETHFANATQLSIPSALANTVNSVRGLDDFRLKPRLQFVKSRSAVSNPHFTDGLTGNHYLAPGDLAVIYDLNPLYTAGDTGKGVTIAIVGQTDIVPADISDFRGAAGLSVNNPTVFTVPGTTPLTVAAGAASNDLAETDLDLEWSGGVATGASILLVNSDNVFNSLQYAIQNPINGITVPIISQSYGACEPAYMTSTLTAIEGWLAQANSQGQTVILASGDVGAADCDDTTNPNAPIVSATQGLAVDYPGSSAYVTVLGGTEFMGDGTAAAPQTGAGTYWSANGSNDVITSAKSYIPEMVWNDTTFSIQNGGGLSAGGGGVSSLWPKPTWQTGVTGIPADAHRDVPDVSMAASPDHDGYLYCTQVQTQGSGAAFVSSCQTTSFRLSDGNQSDSNQLVAVAGGTSFAAPTFAGLLSIIEQKLATGGGLGNINPTLYALAANATTYASAFHDVTTGNNQVPCTSSSTNCPSGSNQVIGYAAAAGYDLATGLGSVDGNNLASAFATQVALVGTKTVLTAAPGTSVVIDEPVTFTATITPNTLSTAPTGTVTFFVDGTAQLPAATITAAAPYTATFKIGFPGAGAHTVTATFSSTDSTYTGSTSSSVTVTVVAQGTAATTTAVSASPTAFALGGSVTLTATVSGTTAGTLTGPVTFTTGGVTIGTVKQVTLATGNTATAVLNVANANASLGFAPGTDTITASYGGDTYNASSSGTTTVTVSNPGITLAATNITIPSASPGNSGTSTITLTSTGGYAGTATLTASASTLNANYGFGSTGSSTASVALAAGGTGTTTVTITTVAANGNIQKGPKVNLQKTAARIAVAGGTLAGCLLLLLVPGVRKKKWPAALVMLVFLGVGAGLGCGGGTGGGAPKGTYTVTISAVDSSNSNITGSTTFTVTIN